VSTIYKDSVQQKPNLRCKKEGVKQIGRPAGNSESCDDDKKCRVWYTFEELEGESSKS